LRQIELIRSDAKINFFIPDKFKFIDLYFKFFWKNDMILC
jgi:hypothetical protein